MERSALVRGVGGSGLRGTDILAETLKVCGRSRVAVLRGAPDGQRLRLAQSTRGGSLPAVI